MESENISASLIDEELWDAFHCKVNEMIVTKSGRRMFPVMRITLDNLHPDTLYSVLLDFKQINDHKWKFVNGVWLPGAKGEALSQQKLYLHPDSPNFGSHWMKNVISFNKLKLTNKRATVSSTGHMLLNSLHKYESRIHVVKVGTKESERQTVGMFNFEKTQFIAVTAYQNEEITSLKIKHNPFAKAFQDSKHKACSVSEFSGKEMDSESVNPWLFSRQSLLPSTYLRQNIPASSSADQRDAQRVYPYTTPVSRHSSQTGGLFYQDPPHQDWHTGNILSSSLWKQSSDLDYLRNCTYLHNGYSTEQVEQVNCEPPTSCNLSHIS